MGGASIFRCGAFDDYAAGLPIAASVGDGNHNHKERSAEKGTTLEAFQERIRQPLRSFIRASRHESQIRPEMKRSSAITLHSPRPDTAIGQVDPDPSAV